jgi:small subunit ribosomal protein S19
MTRAKWKGPYIDLNVFKNKKKVWSRASTIPGSLIGKSVLIHNGREFKRILVTRDKVGFKFGEFSFTRKHTSKQNNNLLKQKKK